MAQTDIALNKMELKRHRVLERLKSGGLNPPFISHPSRFTYAQAISLGNSVQCFEPPTVLTAFSGSPPTHQGVAQAQPSVNASNSP